MRKCGWMVLAVAVLCSGCFDNPAGEYAQRLVGSWRMAGKVMGKPADGMLHIMREGDYILDNRDSAKVAQVAPSGAGRWSILRDQLELMAQEASPMSGAGLDHAQAQSSRRLIIVSLDHDRLVTSDPDYGVKVEWVRVSPLN
ncbi:MAG TPA: hypothetical protein VN066_08580 [Rhodocyclaceae bacterium]|nr:hypothetical protein [Rhodocyclaceae bacterium]